MLSLPQVSSSFHTQPEAEHNKAAASPGGHGKLTEANEFSYTLHANCRDIAGMCSSFTTYLTSLYWHFFFHLIFIVFFPLPFSPLMPRSSQQSPHCCPCPWVLFPFCSIPQVYYFNYIEQEFDFITGVLVSLASLFSS